MSPGGGEEGCWGSSRCAPTPLAFSVCPSVCTASVDLCPLSAQARSSLCLAEPQLKPSTPAEGRAAASSACSSCTKRWLKGEGSVRLLLCLLHAGTGLCHSCSPGQALPRARTGGAVGEWQWAAYRAGGASDPLFAYKIQSTVSSIRVPVSHSHTQLWGRACRGLIESSCSPLPPARSAGPGPGGHPALSSP